MNKNSISTLLEELIKIQTDLEPIFQKEVTKLSDLGAKGKSSSAYNRQHIKTIFLENAVRYINAARNYLAEIRG